MAALGGRRRPGAPRGEDPGGAGGAGGGGALPGLLSELSPLPVGRASAAAPAPNTACSGEMFIWSVA